MRRKTKLIFPFMTISIEVDDYQVVNITEGLKYHMRITLFILKPPGSLRCSHSEKASKMARRKTRWCFLQVLTTHIFMYIILSLFRKFRDHCPLVRGIVCIHLSIHTCIHTMHNIAIRNVRIMYFQGVKNLCKHSQILVSKIMILTFRQTASLIRSYRFILEPGYTPIAYKVRTTCN